MAEVAHMTDRELLVLVVEKVEQIEQHQARTNGQVATLNIQHYEQRGAIAALRWMMTATLGGIGGGAAIAGVILTIVVKGGTP